MRQAFRRDTIRGALLVVALPLLAFTGPAHAEDWTRQTVRGGEISRSVTGEAGHYDGSTTRSGPNGAVYTSNGQCVSGVVDRCGRSYSAVGPNGATITGRHGTASGPSRLRTARGIEGPDGGRFVSVQRFAR
ncbi:hypothetical protein [Rhizobium sp. FY34]|uniref:hypothetical protein n=1 Tax=Rhizobium sp. FY34 TaxID=2562309 RepID=UPI0010C0F394|nr:hypothetical protein [Rhizobium sp. FY34]